MIPDRMTPKQYADTIAIDLLETAYRHIEAHHSYDGVDLAPGQARQVMRHLAQQHNRLLGSSSLDGLALDETPAAKVAA